MELELSGFDRSEEREIRDILSRSPIEDDLLEDFSPVLVKTGTGRAELKVTATGTSSRGEAMQEKYTVNLPPYLDLKALIGAVRAHLHNPGI